LVPSRNLVKTSYLYSTSKITEEKPDACVSRILLFVYSCCLAGAVLEKVSFDIIITGTE
jgi:hypothetical protein